MIAVVDDDASVCKALSRLLRSSGLDATAYSSGRDFLENGATRNPDCLILDVQMPGMSGTELRDRLNARPRHIPVVFITAHDDAAAREKALGGGAVAHLYKPFSDAELLEAVAAALKNAPDGAEMMEDGQQRDEVGCRPENRRNPVWRNGGQE